MAGTRARRDQSFRRERIQPTGDQLLRVLPFQILGEFQQAQTRPYGHLLAAEERADRRQVMRADGGHAAGPPVLRAQRRAVRFAGEPEHVGAEDAAVGQVLPDPRVHRAEVLADRQRAGPRGLAGQRAHGRPVVVPHVRAAVRGHALRHPPQPHQPHHVVHPEAARVPQRRPEQVQQRAVADFRQPPRIPRRLPPVLAELVEPVRRRPHADPVNDLVPVGPRVRAAGVRADGQVMDEADGHSGRPRGLLRRCQLLVGEPLQPGVEARGRAQRAALTAFFAETDIPCLIGPAAPVRPVQLGQRAPGGPVLQVDALPLTEAPVSGPPAIAQRDLVDDLQGGPLGGPDRVPVDQLAGGVAGPQRRGQFVDVLALVAGQLLVLRDVLDPQVERAGEPPGHRQVGRRADRRQRLGRVQRVDQHESGAEVTGAPGGQVGQVTQVAMAPGGAGAERVQLDGEAPGPGGRSRGNGALVSRSARPGPGSRHPCRGRCRPPPGSR